MREVRVGGKEDTLKACMSEMRDELCIFARTCAASSVVPRRARTFSCSHNMSSVIGVCSWGGCEGVKDHPAVTGTKIFVSLLQVYGIGLQRQKPV